MTHGLKTQEGTRIICFVIVEWTSLILSKDSICFYTHTHTHTHTFMHINLTHCHTLWHRHTYVYIGSYAHTHSRTHTHMQTTHTHTHWHVHSSHTHKYTHTHMHIHAYILMHAHIYTQTLSHTHTHICTQDIHFHAERTTSVSQITVMLWKTTPGKQLWPVVCVFFIVLVLVIAVMFKSYKKKFYWK